MTTFYTYKDIAGEWRWRLKHNSNGNIIADSGEGYDSLADCLHGIDLVKGSSGSPVKDG